MKNVFNNDFFQFVAGFLIIILASLAVIFVTQTVMENREAGEGSTRTLPAATTSVDLSL